MKTLNLSSFGGRHLTGPIPRVSVDDPKTPQRNSVSPPLRPRFQFVGVVGMAVFLGGLLLASLQASTLPSRGSAVVDGMIGEWQLTEDDFGEICHFTSFSREVLAKLYLRYDCDSETLYILTLQTSPDYPVVTRSQEAWAAINSISNKRVTDNSGNNGVPPDFAWVDENYAGSGTARGWEGSFSLSAGAYLTAGAPEYARRRQERADNENR